MRRVGPVILYALLAVLLLVPAASADPSPDPVAPPPDAEQPAPDPVTPDPTPTETPTYTPSPTPTYTPPVVVAPQPAAPGTAGADFLSGVGVQVRKPVAAGGAATVDDETAPEPETETVPATTSEEDEVTGTTATAETTTAATEAETEAASTDAATTEAAVIVTPAEPPDDAEGAADDGGQPLPKDALALLGLVLVGGVAVALRALHGSPRERRLGYGLLGFCAVYLIVLGGVVAGVARAATPTVHAFTATPGDGAVLLRWNAPPAGTTVKVVRVPSAPAAGFTCGTGTVVYTGSGSSALDDGVPNDVLARYAACAITGGTPSTAALASATPTGGVDTTAPAAPRGLTASTSAIEVKLAWKLPADDDLAEIVVVRRFGTRTPAGVKDGVVVFKGLATSALDQPLTTKKIRYAAFAVDEDGLASPAAVLQLRRFAPTLIAPRTGVVANRPTFKWAKVRGADYYNIQLWKPDFIPGGGGKKVITATPKGTSLRAPKRLSAGKYTWYVFAHVRPGTGSDSFKTLGSSTFVVP